MADVVLTVLRRPELVGSLLDAGAQMAQLMDGARLNVLAIREPFHVSGLAAEALIEEAESVVRAKQHEGERMTALRRAFDGWLPDSGVQVHWVEVEGSAPAIIAERGSRSDLIVAGQPLLDDRLARQSFSAALFGTDRPVLMVPAGTSGTFGRHVVIAWRDEKRAITLEPFPAREPGR